jgi:hypothetical protein
MSLSIAKCGKMRELTPYELGLVGGGSEVDYTVLGYSADGTQAFVQRTERFDDGNIEITFHWMDSVSNAPKFSVPAVHTGG